MLIYISVAAVLLVVAVSVIYNSLVVRDLRLKGLYPKRGQATMQHVESLVRSGRKILAIRAYREIHGVNLKRAKQAVEKIAP